MTGKAVRVLICSGFFESTLPSYREYSYSKELSKLGYDVSLMCGDQSQIWKGSRVELPLTNPSECDAEFCAATGVKLWRRRVLLRWSDFVFYWPALTPIRRADIVHVIEFRQGVTLLVALIAKLMGKPVVYDHEQRGDRTAKWYSRCDSVFRRLLIAIGSLTPNCVRHTVLANRDHFRSCSLRKVEEMFAPLGADPAVFYYDEEERKIGREKLGICPSQKCAIMSGKLHRFKLVEDVVEATRNAGCTLILVGWIAPDLRNTLVGLRDGEADILMIEGVAAGELRKLYNVADVAVFTTFTLSYWEASATGISLIVPKTEFTKFAMKDAPGVEFFGDPEMFSIPDEQYKDGISIASDLTKALLRVGERSHSSNPLYLASTQVLALSKLYRRLLGNEASA